MGQLVHDHIIAQRHGAVHQRRVQAQAAVGPHAAPAALRRRIGYAPHVQAHTVFPQVHAGRKHLAGTAFSPVPQEGARITAAGNQQPSVEVHTKRHPAKLQAQLAPQPRKARAVLRHKRGTLLRSLRTLSFNPPALLLDKRLNLADGHRQRRTRNKRTPAFDRQRKGAPVRANQPVGYLHALIPQGNISHSSCRDNSRPCAQR